MKAAYTRRTDGENTQ